MKSLRGNAFSDALSVMAVDGGKRNIVMAAGGKQTLRNPGDNSQRRNELIHALDCQV